MHTAKCLKLWVSGWEITMGLSCPAVHNSMQFSYTPSFDLLQYFISSLVLCSAGVPVTDRTTISCSPLEHLSRGWVFTPESPWRVSIRWAPMCYDDHAMRECGMCSLVYVELIAWQPRTDTVCYTMISLNTTALVIYQRYVNLLSADTGRSWCTDISNYWNRTCSITNRLFNVALFDFIVPAIEQVPSLTMFSVCVCRPPDATQVPRPRWTRCASDVLYGRSTHQHG